MNQNSKIYVAGHRGLVGRALMRNLTGKGYGNIVTQKHEDLNLSQQDQVRAYFEKEKPEYVFLAAAKVGGIHANNSYPADFVYQNLMIQANVINAAYENKVKRLLFLGSSCIYPKHCPQPMGESSLLTGPLEPTNRPYAVAKIAGIELCWSFNRQYGTKYLAVMPTNLYGIGDNYSLMNSHVIPAMIRKFHLAKMAMEKDVYGIIRDEKIHGEIPPDIKDMLGLKADETISSDSVIADSGAVILWGSGTPYREFLFSDDMAEACVYLMSQDDLFYDSICFHQSEQPPLINIGFGKDITIKDLANEVRAVVGYKGDICFDSTKPDGAPKKLLDVKKLNSLGWHAKTELRVGLQMAYDDYLKRMPH